jgi:hypothetical protein
VTQLLQNNFPVHLSLTNSLILPAFLSQIITLIAKPAGGGKIFGVGNGNPADHNTSRQPAFWMSLTGNQRGKMIRTATTKITGLKK